MVLSKQMNPDSRTFRKNGPETRDLLRHMAHRLAAVAPPPSEFPGPMSGDSAVLLLLGACGGSPCIILNKRSRKVRQPGDLCCPGGRVSPAIDRLLGKALKLPGLPLSRQARWSRCRALLPNPTGPLSTLLATGLRESLEEMRLNPFAFRLLGPLPVQRLKMFQRTIYPFAGWVSGKNRFVPNWEVEKIVWIPLAELLRAERYGRYRIRIEVGDGHPRGARSLEYPCYLHPGRDGQEILWGATYRIVTTFLREVFGFAPPTREPLPVVSGVLGSAYLHGSR